MKIRILPICITAISLFLVSFNLSAQEDTERDYRFRFGASLDLDSWFDNREYKNAVSPDQTLFGLMLTPQVNLGWGKGNGIFLGTNLTLEFGDKQFKRDPELILYYNYKGDRFNVYAGIFPRRKTLGDYPRIIFSDSLQYYDSNVEGALFQYSNGRNYIELGCDWFSMISESRREKFVIFSSGLYKISNKVHAGYYASILHHSVSYSEEGVVDNILAYPYAALDLMGKDHKGRNSGLYFRAGWVQAMQRDRANENVFLKPGGVQLELRLEKWKLGVYNTLYLGDDLMPYYSRYGSGLYLGDALYQLKHWSEDGTEFVDSKVYNRLELYWNVIKRRDISLSVSSVHHYHSEGWGSQQLIRFSINLNKDNIRFRRQAND